MIDRDGKRRTSSLDVEQAPVDLAGWNQYQIIACGSRLTLKINGVTTIEVIDDEKLQQDLTGKLALQIHSGPR